MNATSIVGCVGEMTDAGVRSPRTTTGGRVFRRDRSGGPRVAGGDYSSERLPATWVGIMRRRIRLPLDAYAQHGSVWLVTIGTRNRQSRPFDHHGLAADVLGALVQGCGPRGADLHLAVIMPDHGHLIVEIGDGHLVHLMRDLKSITTRIWWSYGGTGAIWQTSFYDRGLRSPGEFEAAVKYVLDNPSKEGLCSKWSEYPHFAGGVLLDEDSGELRKASHT